MELRPYQQKAVDAGFNSWREFSKTLLVLPTGTGKTVRNCSRRRGTKSTPQQISPAHLKKRASRRLIRLRP